MHGAAHALSRLIMKACIFSLRPERETCSAGMHGTAWLLCRGFWQRCLLAKGNPLSCKDLTLAFCVRDIQSWGKPLNSWPTPITLVARGAIASGEGILIP